MPPDPRLRDVETLEDMLAFARRVVEFTAGYDLTRFHGDPRTQSAVLHQLLLLGEATKRLSPELRARVEDVPWRQIAGMRDHVVHGYDDVDLEEVWKTVTRDIPQLLLRLEQVHGSLRSP